MKVERLKNKIKITFEYPRKLYPSFTYMSKKDLKELIVNVFLHSGKRIAHDEIKEITFKLNDSEKTANEK